MRGPRGFRQFGGTPAELRAIRTATMGGPLRQWESAADGWTRADAAPCLGRTRSILPLFTGKEFLMSYEGAEPEYYVGCDLHDRNVYVVVVRKDGSVVRR